MARVSYEWDWEMMDRNGEDILDHLYQDTPYPAPVLSDGATSMRLVLVRDVGSEDEGLVDRTWAYVREDGTLPDRFEDSDGCCAGYVPKRFHREIAKANW